MRLALLQTGKRYIALSVNGVKHPNDFPARICAMYLVTASVDYDRLDAYAYKAKHPEGFGSLRGTFYLESFST